MSLLHISYYFKKNTNFNIKHQEKTNETLTARRQRRQQQDNMKHLSHSFLFDFILHGIFLQFLFLCKLRTRGVSKALTSRRESSLNTTNGSYINDAHAMERENDDLKVSGHSARTLSDHPLPTPLPLVMPTSFIWGFRVGGF